MSHYLIACLKFSGYFILLKFVFRCTHDYMANYQEIIELMYMQFHFFLLTIGTVYKLHRQRNASTRNELLDYFERTTLGL